MNEIALGALLIGAALTLVVGLLLGMVGGGGSIVVVPILVYVVGLSAPAAIALSLPIVGVTSFVGAAIKARRGEVHGRAILMFGGAGALGALGGARLTPLVPAPVLLLMFAALLFVVGAKMWRGAATASGECDNQCRVAPCALAGGVVGVLTGFLGVGGGFLLVPALRRFAHQSMTLATGTSLGIIALNSAAGFAAHINQVHDLLPLAAWLTGAALVGLGFGLHWAARVPARALEQTFAAVALGVATYLAIVNAPAVAGMLG